MTTVEFFKNRKIALFLAFCCTLAWAGAFPLIKYGYRIIELPTLYHKFVFAGVRFAGAGVVSLIIAGLMGKSLAVPPKAHKNLVYFTLVNIFFHYLLSYTGLAYATSSRSVILDSLGSFILILISCFLFKDDNPSMAKLFGCILGFSGIVVMNYNPGEDFFKDITFMGDGMIVINTFFIAFGSILAKIVSREMDVMVATAYSLLFGGAGILAVGFLLGGSISFTSFNAVLTMALLISISAFSFSVYNQLISYNPISKIAIFNALMPIMGIIISGWLLNEPFVLRYYIAAIVVAFGIYVINRNR